MLRKLSQDEEIAKLKGLLTEACDTLSMYYPELFSSRLNEWYTSIKFQRVQSRISSSDAGLADCAIQTLLEAPGEVGEVI